MHETSNDFLLYNKLFIYQVICTLIYRRRSLYSLLLVTYDISQTQIKIDVAKFLTQ